MSNECGNVLLTATYAENGKIRRVKLALFDDSVILYEFKKNTTWLVLKVWELPDAKYKKNERDQTVELAIKNFKKLVKPKG